MITHLKHPTSNAQMPPKRPFLSKVEILIICFQNKLIRLSDLKTQGVHYIFIECSFIYVLEGHLCV